MARSRRVSDAAVKFGKMAVWLRTEIAREWPDASLPGARGRVSIENLFRNAGGRIPRLERQRMHFAARGFHFFASGDEMRPIRSLYQHVGQYCGNQFSRRIFVEKGDRVHRF